MLTNGSADLEGEQQHIVVVLAANLLVHQLEDPRTYCEPCGCEAEDGEVRNGAKPELKEIYISQRTCYSQSVR